jgi:adenylate cyclase
MEQKGFHRKLTAILSADVAGYSRLMQDDEAATVATLESYKQAFFDLIKQHRGRVVDSPGDNLLAEFASVVDAVQCAVAVQKELQARNTELPENRRMQFRIGVNLGDVIEEESRIYGDGVNIAARLESLADPGGICISKTAFDQIETKLPFGYEYLGEQSVKNMARAVGAYKVLMEPRVTVAGAKGKAPKPPLWRYKSVLASAMVVLLAIIGVGVWNFYWRAPKIEPASIEKMALPLPDLPSIAVLPFKNMSEDPKQEIFCDGITEEIITGLSKVPEMFVIARNSSFTYKGKPTKVQQVAQDLGVKYVLEGSVRRSQENLRITAQLIDAIKGHNLWADRWDRELKDVFAIQDEITLKIITAMQVKLTSKDQARILAKGTNNLDAYLKVLEANELVVRFNQESNLRARQLSKEAIELDHQYAVAYTILGKTHMLDVWLGTSGSPKESMAQGIQLAQRAIEIDGSAGRAHGLLGFLYTMTGQHDRGIVEAEKAIALEPNSDLAYQYLGLALRFGGKPNEAIPVIKKAIRLNPFAPSTYVFNLGLSYLFSGQYEEGLAECEKATAREPKNLGARLALTIAYSFLNRDEAARASAEEVLRIDPKFFVENFSKTLVYKNEADKIRFIDALRKAGLPDKPPMSLPDKPSIAVLPFANLSNDPEQEYFCDGIADQIINSIANIPYIEVVARNSSFAYKGKSVNVQQIAKDLGVRYILEGSLQRDNENVRINAQLIDAKTGRHLWAEHYDRRLTDIFLVQDEICKNIMVALQVKLTVGESARTVADTVSIKAYEKFLKGTEHLLLRSKENVLIARQLAQEAIAIDPKYAAAYVLVGWSYLDEVWFGMTKTPEESIAKAEEMAQKAVSIHGFKGEENSLLSSVNLLKKDLEKAIFYAEKALEQRPNSAVDHFILGMALRYNGQYDEAISRFKKALQLNPVKPLNYLNNLAWAYLFSRQYEKAIPIWNETLERNPDYLFAYLGLTIAYGLSGSEGQAQQAAKHVLRINPKFSMDYWDKQDPTKDKELKKQNADALRRAGLQ